MAIWAKTAAILVILASHFRTMVDTPKKSSTQGPACINETKLHPDLVEIRPTGSQAKKSILAGLRGDRTRNPHVVRKWCGNGAEMVR